MRARPGYFLLSQMDNTTPAPLPGNTPVMVLSGKYRKRKGLTCGSAEPAGSKFAGLYLVLLEPERPGCKRPEEFFGRTQLEVAA
jgi:hypothetical protein